MPKRTRRPPWVSTNLNWDSRVVLWDRMAKGETDSQIAKWTESQEESFDRGTIAKVREELEALPEESAKNLSEEIQRFREELRLLIGDEPVDVKDLPRTADAVKTSPGVNDRSVKDEIEKQRLAEVAQMSHLTRVLETTTRYDERLRDLPDNWRDLSDEDFSEMVEELRVLISTLTGEPSWPMLTEHMKEDLSKEVSYYVHIPGGLTIIPAPANPGNPGIRKLAEEAHTSVLNALMDIRLNLAPDDPDWLWREPRCRWCEPIR